jgi:hypothetical protein
MQHPAKGRLERAANGVDVHVKVLLAHLFRNVLR